MSTHEWAHLGDSVETVCGQLDSGSNVLESLLRILKKYSDIERKFGAEIQKMFAKESQKLKSKGTEDQLGSLSASFRDILGQLGRLSDSHDTHASETSLLHNRIATGFDQYKKRSNEIKNTLKQNKEEINTLKTSLKKQKIKCQKSIQAIDSPQTSDKLGKYMRNASSDPTLKAFQTIQDYEKQHEDAQTAINEMVESNFSKLCVDVQKTESFRFVLLRSACSDLSLGLQMVPGAYSNRSAGIKQACDQMNIEEDMRQFAKTCQNFGPSSQFRVSDDLEISKERVIEKLSRAQKLQLGVTDAVDETVIGLSTLMAKQKKTDPFLHLPKIVLELRKSLKLLDGYKTEGIFRISPSSNKLAEFMGLASQGQFDIPNGDVHIAAAGLKSFLRSLESPLIPVYLYPRCVEAGSFDDIQEALIGQLATEEKALLMCIVDICRQIVTNPESRMTFDNLAIVFSPYILHQGTKASTVNSMMQSAQIEIPFVSQILSTLTVDNSLLNKEYPIVLPPHWSAFSNDEGTVYYHNSETGISQWEAPI